MWEQFLKFVDKLSDGSDNMLTAVPFDNANYRIIKVEGINNAEYPEVTINNIPSTNNDSEQANPLRISTRAKRSYELDRYSKHAMLIFEGNASGVAPEALAEDTSTTENMASKFKQIFEKYLFEIEIHINLNDTKIANVCDKFFQRDFTEYGCVGVMMIPKTKDGVVESIHTPVSERGVFRYLSDQMPPTLKHKPKIYIVQTEAHYVIPRARLPTQISEDILEFRFPVPVTATPNACGGQVRICCLLNLIYEKIKKASDDCDLKKILDDSLKEFKCLLSKVLPSYDFHNAFISTLTKELRLVVASQPSA